MGGWYTVRGWYTVHMRMEFSEEKRNYNVIIHLFVRWATGDDIHSIQIIFARRAGRRTSTF